MQTSVEFAENAVQIRVPGGEVFEIGFKELSGKTHTPAKRLMRMLGPKGNPQAPASITQHGSPSEEIDVDALEVSQSA